MTPSAIVEQVWKVNFDTMTNVDDVDIHCLRRKLDSGCERALMRTVRGVGYRIGSAAPAARSAAASSSGGVTVVSLKTPNSRRD